jgi:hypothetical protein
VLLLINGSPVRGQAASRRWAPLYNAFGVTGWVVACLSQGALPRPWAGLYNRFAVNACRVAPLLRVRRPTAKPLNNFAVNACRVARLLSVRRPTAKRLNNAAQGRGSAPWVAVAHRAIYREAVAQRTAPSYTQLSLIGKSSYRQNLRNSSRDVSHLAVLDWVVQALRGKYSSSVALANLCYRPAASTRSHVRRAWWAVSRQGSSSFR